MSQFIHVDYEPTGFHAACEGTDCGDRSPRYRAMLGTFMRFFCEGCMTQVLLDGMPVKSPAPEGYMNPGGEF